MSSLKAEQGPTAQSIVCVQEVNPLVGMNEESPTDFCTVLPSFKPFHDLLLNPFPPR